MILIQGGLVKTITGGDIENGQVLIDGGKIVAVRAEPRCSGGYAGL